MAKAAAPVVVNHPPQDVEEFRNPVDSVEDGQLGRLLSKVGVGVVEPSAIRRTLEVEVDRLIWSVVDDPVGKGGPDRRLDRVLFGVRPAN